ncbi:lysin A [Arthrobacter phage Vibaki]|uniref:Lysin A n=1 Tax=Arthrobacter phage Vibaki TaxID=2593333 RepID=A0A514TYX9_9CAUD|nr:metallo-endopeptidase [Arthrobacter phage Vibaki]QDK01908.1 lysin A [Arthrobacter phage Vibaki]
MTYMDPFPKGTRISQEFRSSPGGFNPAGGHTGRDYAVPVGTPIRAAADGVIRHSSWFTDNYRANDWWLTRYGGDTLVLDCLDAFGRSFTMPTFVYAHCSNSTAKVGQRVKKGQIIGYSGNSGTATSGPHCHVERMNPGFDLSNNVYGRSPLNFDEFYTEDPGPGSAAIAPQGEIVKPAPAPEEQESEVPTYKRVTAPATRRRLAAGKSATLMTDATNAKAQNFAVAGLGHYDVDLFLSGSGLPAGETLTVQFFIIPTGGKPSGYFKQQIHGSADGTFDAPAKFKMPILQAARLEATITSSHESAYLERYSAEVYAWKKA